MSLTMDTTTLESPVAKLAIEPGSADFPDEIETAIEEAHTEEARSDEPCGEEADGDTTEPDAPGAETTTAATNERPREVQRHDTSPAQEREDGKSPRRQRRVRKLILPVPLPQTGEPVTGPARKIGRHSNTGEGHGETKTKAAKAKRAPANGASTKIAQAQSATAKRTAKAKVETEGSSATDAEPLWQIRLIPVEAIGPNPFQPREEFSEAEMEELANSVAEHGVQTPVMVRTIRPATGQAAEEAQLAAATPPLYCFELVAGERRLRASRKAKRQLIPAIVRDDLSDAQAAEIALIENVQRSNLNIIEEARGYKRLMLRFRFTEVRIAKKVGKTVPTIQAAIKLLALPEEVQTLILKRQLTAAHGHELLRLAAHPVICTSAALVAVAERLPATSLVSNPLPNIKELKRRGRVVELGFQTKFDWRSVCRECPFKAFVTSGYGSYCLVPEEWKKKQGHAIEMERQEAARVLEAARQQGEATVESQELSPSSYRSLQWNEPPAGCSAQCPCRGQIVDPRDAAQSIPICLDPARLEELRRVQREAQEAERQRHYNALWEGSVQRLSSEPLASESLSKPSSVLAIPLMPASTLATKAVSPNGWHGEEERKQEEESSGNGAILPALSAAVPEPMEMERPIAWNKVAPLLVLPILRGENCSYGERDEWGEKAQEVASQMGLELPWDEVMGGEEEGDLLRMLEPLPPMRLLLLGALLLLRQEAIHAGHWAGETPFLDFVLDLQAARQSELEVSEVDSDVEDRGDNETAAENTDASKTNELLASGNVDADTEAQIPKGEEESQGDEPDNCEEQAHESAPNDISGSDKEPQNPPSEVI